MLGVHDFLEVVIRYLWILGSPNTPGEVAISTQCFVRKEALDQLLINIAFFEEHLCAELPVVRELLGADLVKFQDLLLVAQNVLQEGQWASLVFGQEQIDYKKDTKTKLLSQKKQALTPSTHVRVQISFDLKPQA